MNEYIYLYMKFIITESQYKILTENKILVMQKLVDTLITNKFDSVCKVDITPPHFYSTSYSVRVHFKDMVSLSMGSREYFRMKTDVKNEVWGLIRDFTNEQVSVYEKIC